MTGPPAPLRGFAAGLLAADSCGVRDRRIGRRWTGRRPGPAGRPGPAKRFPVFRSDQLWISEHRTGCPKRQWMLVAFRGLRACVRADSTG